MNKQINELIFEESAWSEITKQILEAKNEVVVLPTIKQKGMDTLSELQISNKSTLGAIALESGGLLIDHGWLRILGSGNEKIAGDLLSWNCIRKNKIKIPLKGALIIGYDILGGFFAINSGGLGESFKNIYYLAPDTLEWEDTGLGYTDFINWSLNGDLELFYETMRWDEWEEEVESLYGEQGISIYPYLWTEQGKDISKCNRKQIPMIEIWEIENEFKNQFQK